MSASASKRKKETRLLKMTSRTFTNSAANRVQESQSTSFKWYTNRPSCDFFPYPVVDVTRPRGSSCDSCNSQCTGHYVTDIPTLLELPQNNQAIRSLPPSIIIEEAFKKDAEQIDTIALAKKCCLSFKKVEIRLNHLTRKQKTRAKAVEKARKTRESNKAKQKQKIERGREREKAVKNK